MGNQDQDVALLRQKKQKINRLSTPKSSSKTVYYPDYFKSLYVQTILAQSAYANAKGLGWGDFDIIQTEWSEDPNWPLEEHLRKRLNNPNLKVLSAHELNMDPSLFTQGGFYKKSNQRTYAMAFVARDNDKLYLAFRGSSTRYHFVNVVSQGEYAAYYPLYDDFIKAITHYIHTHDISDVTVSGHSLGGGIGVMTLQQYKKEIIALAQSGISFHFNLVAPTKNQENVDFSDFPGNVEITRLCNLEDVSTNPVLVKNSDWSTSNQGINHIAVECVVPKIQTKSSIFDVVTKPLIRTAINKMNDYSGINHDCRKYIQQIQLLSQIPIHANPFEYVHSFIDTPHLHVDYRHDQRNHVYIVADFEFNPGKTKYSTILDGPGHSFIHLPKSGAIYFDGTKGCETVICPWDNDEITLSRNSHENTLRLDVPSQVTVLKNVENILFNDCLCSIFDNPDPHAYHSNVVLWFPYPSNIQTFDFKKHHTDQRHLLHQKK